MSAGACVVELMVGARGEPESLLEHAEATELEEESEGAGMIGASVDGRVGAGEAWLGGALLGWVFLPEGEASALRIAPAAGWVHGDQESFHLDVAGRYALEWVPTFPVANGGRADVNARVGAGVGAHRLELWGAVVDHRFFSAPWSFTTAELGPQWRFEQGIARLSARATGQGNWSAAGPGGQARLRLGAGIGRGGFDLDGAWQLTWAGGSARDPVYRPPFDPLGAADEDADALSGVGFVQQRVDVAAVAASGPWSLAVAGIGRLRNLRGGGVDTTLHVGVNGGRTLGGTLALHATAGLNAWQLGDVSLVDPFGWVGLSASFPSARPAAR